MKLTNRAVVSAVLPKGQTEKWYLDDEVKGLRSGSTGRHPGSAALSSSATATAGSSGRSPWGPPSRRSPEWRRLPGP